MKDSELCGVCKNGNHCALLIGLEISTVLWKTVIEVSQNTKKRISMRFSNPTAEHILRGIEPAWYERPFHIGKGTLLSSLYQSHVNFLPKHSQTNPE
jgi:hypothetical protein